jgi:hypothetical protein
MLCVVIIECYYVDCSIIYAMCCHYPECYYDDCHYAECHGAVQTTLFLLFILLKLNTVYRGNVGINLINLQPCLPVCEDALGSPSRQTYG